MQRGVCLDLCEAVRERNRYNFEVGKETNLGKNSYDNFGRR